MSSSATPGYHAPPTGSPVPPQPRQGADIAALGQLVLFAALATGALLRVALAFGDDGIYWPDEIYQSLEPAHRLAFGYGLVAWEFAEGARSWAFPGLIAAVLRLTAAVGLEHPRQYLTVVRLVFCAAGVATAYASFALARRLGASALHAACGACLFALGAPALYFAPRALSESASGLLVAFGLAWALPKNASRREVALGAALLAGAVFLRLHAALFCGALLITWAARRAWPRLATASAVFAAGALLYGLLDALTWGRAFGSALAYLQFNLVEGKSALWGVSDWRYYGREATSALGPCLLAGAALAVLGARRAAALAACAAAFVAVHSAVPHKELRFLLPVLPLLGALAAVGLTEVSEQVSAPAALGAAGLLVVTTAWSAATHRRLTFGDLGQYEPFKAHQSAYDDFGAVNRLLLKAHGQSDLCGLKVEAAHLAWTGGHSYLHRPVPLYPHTTPREHPGFNYLLTVRGAGGEQLAVDGPYALVRWRAGCEPDPAYAWRLP